jgi:hypothetical protein
VGRIAAPVAPDVASDALGSLARELYDLAQRDPRFERASMLAKELEEELMLLPAVKPSGGRTRRQTARRPRAPRTAPRAIEAFEAEFQALNATYQQLGEQGITISSEQLSDLRLGARTRRIFEEAGLLYVQDVASLPLERAAKIPHLVPASIAEVRAAIMFSVETAGAQRSPVALPSPSGDLFEGLAHGVNQLPPREREVVVLRTGVEDRVHAVADIARAVGCDVEMVPQLERRALNTLLSHPGALEACWRLEDLCAQLGLGWQDERLATVVAARYPNTRTSFTRLVSWLMREKGQLAAEAGGRTFSEPAGIPHFEEMVVAALGRYGDLAEGTLTNHVRAALSPGDRENYPDVEVSERVQILGPAVQAEGGVFRLPDAPIPGLDDRHIRALNGLIGALQRLGTARISSLTTEVNRRLPRSYQINDQYVRSWLTRHPELFTQSDQDRFKLASLDVDILCGLATSWMPANSASASATPNKPGDLALERLRDRAAVEIAEFLRDRGPQPIGRIRSHLYGRVIGASADLVIAQRPQRFERQPGGLISLRDVDEFQADELFDVGASSPEAARRVHFWRNR